MANYATLKSDLDGVIKTNITRSITGDVLNSQLDAIIDSLGAGFQYMGLATPATNPGTPDARVAYLAATPGTYINFGGLTLTEGKIAFLRYDGTWHKDEVAVQPVITMDDSPTEGSDNPVKSGGIFSSLQEKQDNIIQVNVLVDNNTGIPAGTASFENGVLTIALSCIKGAQGNSGYQGAAGELEVVNNRTQGGSEAALSAEMGKEMDADMKSLALMVKSNVMAIYNSLANMAFVGDRPNLNWESLDVYVITDFSDPAGATLTDNSIGGMMSFGARYEGMLTANEGYTLSNVSVTMAGGGDISYNPLTGAISANAVTGDITIAATTTFNFNTIGYTSDGLAFALDGKHKGSVANAWTDLIGNQSFANHGAIANNDHWLLDGVDDYLGGWNETELPFDPATCTIEAAFRPTGSSQSTANLCHFCSQTTDEMNGLYICLITSGYINGSYVGNTKNVWASAYSQVNTVLALSAARAYKNGSILSSLGAPHWSGNRQGRYIGTTTDYTKADPTFNKGFFKGEIYAIRIYNRQLTEEEILADMALDNTRFNLEIPL